MAEREDNILNGFLNTERMKDLMDKKGMDGLLICSPENLYYSSGYSPMLLDLYRQVPLGLLLFDKKDEKSSALIVPDTDVSAVQNITGIEAVYGFPVWWENYDLEAESETFQEFLLKKPVQLPEQYDPAKIFEKVAELLAERHLSSATIGIELDFISARIFGLLREINPQVNFVNSTELFYQLRSVKHPEEIKNLRIACELTESGLCASREAFCESAGIGDLVFAFQKGVLNAANEKHLLKGLGSISGQPALGVYGNEEVEHLDSSRSITIKYDMQVSYQHYFSDIGRTYFYGRPHPDQIFVMEGLLEVHQRFLEIIKPGLQICEIYQNAQEVLKKCNLQRHSRGHFGHSVGLDSKIEEPPFISATEKGTLEPGMVLSVETPFYFNGLGKFQIEDMVLVTENGVESFNKLPKKLG